MQSIHNRKKKQERNEIYSDKNHTHDRRTDRKKEYTVYGRIDHLWTWPEFAAAQNGRNDGLADLSGFHWDGGIVPKMGYCPGANLFCPYIQFVV